MRKKELSDEEFDKVRELREAGYSWLKIEQETGVKRRLAKRAYSDWLYSRSLEEIQQARVNVATRAFGEHVDSLVKLAERLTYHIDVPKSFYETRRANDFIRNLWETSILGELYELPHIDTNRKIQRNVRQNQMLFESLQTHTHGKVRWQALDEWKKAWESCLGLFDKLKIEGQKAVTNILSKENNLLEEIRKRSQEEKVIKQLIEVVLGVIWQAILKGKLDREYPKVSFTHQHVADGVPKSTEEEWIARLRTVCQDTAENLLGDSKVLLVQQLYDEVHTMRKAIEELEKMLDPLILRPVILLTPRCKLCAA